MTKRFGFTLAEILITLGIIGVVGAITIPSLVANYQERSYNTTATVFERKLGEALKVMNTQSTLAGFASTEDFIEELSKHFKITKICQNDELMECFEETVFWGGGETPKTVDMAKVKRAKHFGKEEWQQTNVVGVQFANGVSALIAYNKDAQQDPTSNQIVTLTGTSNGKSASVNLGTDALAILYDTNGAKSPNQSNKDLRSLNVTQLGLSCLVDINGVCVTTKPQVPTPHVWNACDANGKTTNPDDLAFMKQYGITYCMSSAIGTSDYWAGAVKLCGGKNKMANLEQLAKIAAYTYNTSSIGAKKDISDVTFDATKAAEFGLTSSGLSIWASEGDSARGVYGRIFNSTNTKLQSGIYRSSSTRRAICIDE